MTIKSTLYIATHYPIAKYAIEHGLHVLLTKPAVQLLKHHIELVELAKKHKVVCMVEHHKRFELSTRLSLTDSDNHHLPALTQYTAMLVPVLLSLASSTSSAHG